MENSTMTTDTIPNVDRSMPVKQRDTYMLIGFCFFSLFLIGIFMAFVHRKCRDSTSKAKQWCLATCCFARMSTPPTSTTNRVPEVLPQEIIPIEAIRVSSRPKESRVNPAYIPDEDEGGGTIRDHKNINPPSRNNSLIKCEVTKQLRSSLRSALPPRMASDLEDDSGISDVSTSPRYNIGRSSRHSLVYQTPPSKSLNDANVRRDGSLSKAPKLVRVLMPESVDNENEIQGHSPAQVYNVSDTYDVKPYYVNALFHEKQRQSYKGCKDKHVYVNDGVDADTHLYENDGVILGPHKHCKLNSPTRQQIELHRVDSTPDNKLYYSMNDVTAVKNDRRHFKTMSNPATRTLPRAHRNAHWHHYENDRDDQSLSRHSDTFPRNQNSSQTNDVADELLVKLARNFFRSKEQNDNFATSEEHDYVEITDNGPSFSEEKDNMGTNFKTHYAGSLDTDDLKPRHFRGSSLGYHSCPDEDLNLETVQFVKTADGRLQQITIRYV